MSPELAAGREDLDARSDVYALGALAYFLLTGQPPFTGRSPVQVLAAHMYEPPAPLTIHRSDVPGELQEVVLRCLAKDPAGRFPDVVALETALGEWAGKAPTNCSANVLRTGDQTLHESRRARAEPAAVVT
jgi:serine/threonine-protein kinase